MAPTVKQTPYLAPFDANGCLVDSLHFLQKARSLEMEDEEKIFPPIGEIVSPATQK